MPPPYQCAACGKTYTSPRFLVEHERKGCAPSKRGLRKILETSKSLWETRKRRRLENNLTMEGSGTASPLTTPGASVVSLVLLSVIKTLKP
jgi:hypothetical protein